MGKKHNFSKKDAQNWKGKFPVAAKERRPPKKGSRYKSFPLCERAVVDPSSHLRRFHNLSSEQRHFVSIQYISINCLSVIITLFMMVRVYIKTSTILSAKYECIAQQTLLKLQ